MKKIDLHVHTTLSSDSTVSLNEAMQAARIKGIDTLAITNHIPELAGKAWYHGLETFKRHKAEAIKAGKKSGVRVLFGMEATSINSRGDLGVPEELLNECDIVISGVHRLFCGIKLNGGFPEEKALNNLHWGMPDYYNQWMGLCGDKSVDVLVHPLWYLSCAVPGEEKKNLQGYFPEVYRESMVKTAVKNGKAIEISALGFPDDGFLGIMKDLNAAVSVGSDAHRAEDVGRVDWCYSKIKEFGFKTSSVIDL